MKPAALTHAAPSVRPGKLDEFTQSESGQGTQHLDPWPVVSRGFFAQLRPPRTVVCSQDMLFLGLKIESKLTAFGIGIEALADEGMRTPASIECDVPKQCKQVGRHGLLLSDFKAP